MNFTLTNKNPFSTFDFLRSLFPGALAVFLFYIISDRFTFHSENRPQIVEILMSLARYNTVVGIFVFVLFSYVIGHIISYISSVTIELFYIWCYGYPRQYLFASKNIDEENAIRNYLDKKDDGVFATKLKARGIILHMIVCIFIFPITICHCVFERVFNLRLFIIRPVDKILAQRIAMCVHKLYKRLGFNEIKDTDNISELSTNNELTDEHRIVMHYVYEHCIQQKPQFDNYIALYGFHRSVSLSFCLALIYILCNYFYNVYEHITLHPEKISCHVCVVFGLLLIHIIAFCLCKRCVKNVTTGDLLLICWSFMSICVNAYFITFIDFEDNQIVGTCILWFAAYITYLGFAKYYRRFTLNNYMALLACDELFEQRSCPARPVILSFSKDSPLTIQLEKQTIISDIFKRLLQQSSQ